MLNPMTDFRSREYDLLNEISQDSLITQANLASRLGIAVGSVNWYLKRLISRGYIKVSHLSRTRLRYDLTPEGMKVFTQRAMQYAKDSLRVYKNFRQKAQNIVTQLHAQGIESVYVDGNDEIMDILRLTCIEADITVDSVPRTITLKYVGQDYQIVIREQ